MRNIADTGVSCRLNLGCGDDIKPGYLNVDFRQTHPNVVIADLSTYPWPFADGCAKEVLMLDFLEHFSYRKTRTILLECARILEDGGTLDVQVPDAEQLAAAMMGEGNFLCNKCGHEMWKSVPFGARSENFEQCPGCKQTLAEIADAAVMRLYGGQNYPGNFHHVCFTRQSLVEKAAACGFRQWEPLDFEHQFKNWNFKLRFTKGDVW